MNTTDIEFLRGTGGAFDSTHHPHLHAAERASAERDLMMQRLRDETDAAKRQIRMLRIAALALAVIAIHTIATL
jgi:hypothetical protein